MPAINFYINFINSICTKHVKVALKMVGLSARKGKLSF